MKRITTALLFTAMMLLGGTHAAAIDFQEGEWEFTAKAEMPGMPMEMPPTTFKTCMTLKNLAPQEKKVTTECQMIKQEISDDTVTWHMRCVYSHGTTEAKGEATYKGDTMQATTHITTTSQGQTMKMKSHVKGHRIGPCKEE